MRSKKWRVTSGIMAQTPQAPQRGCCHMAAPHDCASGLGRISRRNRGRVVYGTKRELSGPANGEFGEAQRNSEAYGAGSTKVADYAALIRPAVFRFAIRTCKWRILSALSTLISGSPDFAENSNPRSYASRGHVSCNNAARPASLARRSIGLRRWPPQHGYIPSTRYPGVVGPASRVAVRLQDARA